MLKINFRFPEQKDAETLNNAICSFFQGSKAFINNDIFVGSVFSSTHKNEVNYFFQLAFIDDSVERSIDIEAAELTVLGIKKIWAFVDETKKTEES